MSPLPRSRPRTVCYLAATDAAARDGAAALERVESGPDRTVQPLTTDVVDRLENWATEADCVVFAETPTTAAGAALLEAAEACGSTPLILFSESAYAPSAARSTAGIDGYVRRDTEDAVAHLADEIEWACAGGDGGRTDGAPELPAVGSASESGPGESSGSGEPSASGGSGETDGSAESSGSDDADTDATDAAPDRRPAARLLEAIPDVAACEERDRLFERLTETAADAVGTEYGWLATVHFGELTPRTTTDAIAAEDLASMPREDPLDGALRSGEPIRIDDLAADDRLEAPLEGTASLCCVPVADVGLLVVADPEPGAFDDRDRDLLAAWARVGAAVLERIERETGLRNERDRLRQELERLETVRDRLEDERDSLADERDRFRSLFANVPEPAVRYEIDGGRPIVRDVNDAFADVFGTDPEAVVDSPLGEETVPPGLEHRQATLTEALRSGERRQLVSRRETVDGVREFCLTLVPLEAAEDGDSDEAEPADEITNPEGLVVYSDVTDANRTERELAAAEARLERIAETLEADVRTPLNVARGYLELAEETTDAEHFAEVETAQERLRERVEELLAIARRNEAVVETEPVAVTDVARRAWVAVDTGDARLVTRENRVLEADKAQLRELFEHLLQAAVESAATGSESDVDAASDTDVGSETDDGPVVTVDATDDGFVVTGHPPGTDVSTDERETTPVSGRLTAADGTGFGLGPVERIADAHGWDVGVADEEIGTTFAFRGIDPADVSGD